MAIIYNSDLIKNLVNAGDLSTAKDKIPNQIADKVVPVIDVNPSPKQITRFIRNAAALNNTGSTILSAATLMGNEVYITGVTLGWTKDAAANMTQVYIQIVQDGANRQIANLAGLNTTAETKQLNISFPYPIKIDRNSAITIGTVGGVAAGNVIWSYCLFYFTEQIV